MLVDEFELIRHYFDRQANVPDVAQGIGDDGAVLRPAHDVDQIQVIDTLVEGVHFPHGTDAADIAYRVVAVNLSDIAAMGGTPRWMTLALTMPAKDSTWLRQFSNGLFEAADAFGVTLVGGDTTSGPALVVTVSMTGDVPNGNAILRDGAVAGDTVFVTGTLGDAAAGLALLKTNDPDGYLQQRFLRPTPRISTGKALAGAASAAIDVSDGLLGDLAKLLTAGGVGAQVNVQQLPISTALRESFEANQCVMYALTGGDDYELCFTARDTAVADISGITAIGKVTQTTGLVCLDDGKIVEVDDSRYRHFQ